MGAGGLGSPAALYLAAAGVGQLGILDRDNVDLSNLHRQVIHTEASVGRHKALSAAAACTGVNSSIKVCPLPVRCCASDFLETVFCSGSGAVLVVLA